MTVLVTGVAGFIGAHVAAALLRRGEQVIGIDNLVPYYNPALKLARLDGLRGQPGFRFIQASIADRAAMESVVDEAPDIDRVVHLAAQAGVRHSLVDPWSYVTANVMGHVTVLEAARRLKRLRHLVYASSSSVYGSSTDVPFTESDRADRPTSLYAATKRADELISHAMWHLHAMPMTGLRFFTVYGPWGRPDMAYFLFAEAIMAGRPITLFENGELRRDFTFIDDIVVGVLAALDRVPETNVPPRVFNLGNNRGEQVSTLVGLLEQGLGRRAEIISAPKPQADVPETAASLAESREFLGFMPQVRLADGVPRFTDWFLDWRKNL